MRRLTISPGTLNEPFAADTTAYTATVMNDVASITVTPFVSDGGATVTVGGTAVVSGSASQDITLQTGDNSIPIVVSASDGSTTKTYTLTITRRDPSTDARLAGLVVTGSDSSTPTLSPEFDRNTFTYTADVSVAVTTATVTATPTQTGASFTVQVGDGSADTGTSGSPSTAGALPKGGRTTFIIAVTASNGSDTATYTVAVNRAIGVPGASASVAATAVPRALDVSWTAPSDFGGVDLDENAITSYRVRWRLTDADGSGSGTDAGEWQNASGDDAECDADPANDHLCGEGVSSGTTYTITGLERVSYDVAVAAVNSVGIGAWTGDTAAQATPAAAADATLAALVVTGSGNTATTLTPGFAADRLDYTVNVANSVTAAMVTATVNQADASITVQIGDGNAAAVDSGTASDAGGIDVGGNTVFTIVVTAEDGATTSTYTARVNRAHTVPMVPTGLVVTGNREGVTLDWVAPADTGSAPITGYRVRWNRGSSGWGGSGGANGIPTGSTDTTYAIIGLRLNDSYTAAVAAVNAGGLGAWTARSASIAISERISSAPRNLAASGDATSLALSWDAPENPGSGQAITGYRVRWKRDSESVYGEAVDASDMSGHTISGLTTGVAYDVQVAARNDSVIANERMSAWTTLTATPASTDNALLQTLVVNDGSNDLPLTKTGALSTAGFDPAHETYSLPELLGTVQNIMVTATPAATAAAFSVNGSAGVRGEASVVAVAIGANTLTIVVTAEDASTTKTYTVSVTRAQPVAVQFLAPQDGFRLYAAGEAVQPVVLPAAEGGSAPYSYALAGLPSGLNFTPATRSINGTLASVTAIADATLTYTVTDSAVPPSSAEQTFTIGVAPPLDFATAPASLSFTYNAAANQTLPAAAGGFAPYAYALSGEALPAGLTFDAGTRVLDGTPSAAGSAALVYTVTDAEGLDGVAAGVFSADIALRIAPILPTALSGLTASPANLRLRLDWSAPSGTAAGGEPPSDYQVRWAEGAGSTTWINPNGDTGESTGSADPRHTITALTNGTTYAVQVAAVNGAGIGAWSESVSGTPEQALAFASQQQDFSYFVTGRRVTQVLVAAEDGSEPYSYEVTGLPGGLSFVADTRTMSGIAEATIAPAAVTYTVTDANSATDTLRFTITVTALSFALDVGDVANTRGAIAADGILIARYLLGVRGPALLSGQSEANVGVVEARIQAGVDNLSLDVDANDVADGNDGILVARYLLGLRGTALVSGIPSAETATAAVVERNIAAALP